MWSIAELEAEFERVQDEGDRQGLQALREELGLRTSKRSRQLLGMVQRFAGSAAGPKQPQGAAGQKQPQHQGSGPKPTAPQSAAGAQQPRQKGGGPKPTPPQGTTSPEQSKHQAGGQKPAQPQSTSGAKHPHPQSGARKQPQPQSASPKPPPGATGPGQPEHQAGGRKPVQPQSASGVKQTVPQSAAGQKPPQHQGSGLKQPQPQSGSGAKQPQPQGTGPKQVQPQGGPGPKPPQRQAISLKQTPPQNVAGARPAPAQGPKPAQPQGAAQKPPQPQGTSGNRAAPSRPRLTPTAEQLQAVDQFKQGGSLKINAYAGTGKTSTLEFLAQSTRRRGQYIAFNRSIVNEAREKFPSTVNCSTTHAMAFRATPWNFKHDEKMTRRIGPHQLAEILKLKRWQPDKNHVFQPRSLGFLILETLRHFMQSADREPGAEHVPSHGSLVAASEETLAAVADFAVRGARHVWKRMTNPEDVIPLGHDGYVKLWALGNPRIPADFILLDEAQDTNPVVLDVLGRQSAQMIYVGDRYQQIYQWRGAVNAMEKLDTDKSAYLTMSFRFGKPIADMASRILALLDETHVITGNPKIASRIGRVKVPDAILGRTNASTITALIESLNHGKKPYLVGGTGEVIEMLKGVEGLKKGMQSTVPEFFGFNSWTEVVDFSKSDEGHHLATFVNLVQSRGEQQLKWALENVVSEDSCDLVISTAHKAKGREWQRVRLMDDFMRAEQKAAQALPYPALPYPAIPIQELPIQELPIQEPKPSDPEEIRLFYVAVTRATECVEVPDPILELME